MTNNILKYANDLKFKIDNLSKIVNKEDNFNIGIYMIDPTGQPYCYHKLTEEQEEKLITILNEDLQKYKDEFENM